MLKKILIANRGEIAARIIRTCKKLGIQSVAVFSEADQHAPYVRMADESYLIGKPRVNESYLNIEKIIEIAQHTSVVAIHPGYGLLSEHPRFAEACKEAGIVFIGPPSEVIAKMGSKVEARKEMEKAGVPVVPGTTDAIQTVEEAVQFATEVGYPVMLKASSGGGGIGMELVHDSEGLKKAFESNSKRALAFFGDGTMFIEKKIENARHIEIQIMADQFGNVVHLFERECSIQRRHQKVLEEAPSPFLSEKTRKKMGAAAIQAAKTIGYYNAGTIEFLVDEDENFYFLEMNTRLQVEHPVTEEITGIDIVEQQINIAAGQALHFDQTDVQRHGHAIEVRIYAEDPVNFFPSPGQITKLIVPEGIGIRNELAVEEKSMVTPYYDPMIAKLIATGNTREEAIDKLSGALRQYKIEGIKTNLPLLKEILKQEAFQTGNTLTSFIDTYYIPQSTT
ncbi:acetyl-CoA carboxylase biotin carboxylase subunit [Terrihalobacillus insolitus]|uniref:acetyl-CoA carboxylase biotin carboxylase subunit n=1 Tax=Terrihalobacillus insolitus TaxID=2950438 RepID=UPI002341FABB|nr:acetyl-CoA carboxylase biotin carboxylase subunit [Terrihalobacillus insolitus]MDC3415039.1 acetyl-CoA carboxylase biotin carboxylase subunit [Terrihalobacillus insolitus]